MEDTEEIKTLSLERTKNARHELWILDGAPESLFEAAWREMLREIKREEAKQRRSARQKVSARRRAQKITDFCQRQNE